MNQTKNQHSSSHDFIDQKIYAKWIKKFDTISRHDEISIREHIDKLEVKPLISIIMPVYNTPENYLISAIESVRSQIYPNWELCIADDASTLNHVKNVLKQYASLDPKIKITYRKTNGNISAASNSALETASGDFVALMDHDDMLPSHALFMVALEINNQPDANLIYSDSDYLDTNGNRCNPYFKPDWNYDLFLGQNYITHLSVYRHSVIKKINGFRTGFEGSQDYDLALRFIEFVEPSSIRHIPHILYHWRIVISSFSRTRLAEATRIARIAIQEHLDRRNEPTRVSGAPGNIL
ncbi:MAG: glycosyltransferase, partial [Desulfobacterales bacterium]|nr:glycosyltransferase [Desulfobacterales bacterium]